MEPKKQVEQTGEQKVLEFPVSGGKMAQAVRTARTQLEQWRECFFSAGGVFTEIFVLVGKILQAIESALDQEEVAKRVAELVVECHKFHEALSAAPFNNPSLEQFQQLGAQFRGKEKQLAELDAERGTLISELTETRQQLKNFEATGQAVRQQVQKLETELCQWRARSKDQLFQFAREFQNSLQTFAAQVQEQVQDAERFVAAWQNSRPTADNQGSGTVPTAFSAERLVAELTRREQWLAELDSVQAEAEAALDENEVALEEIQNLLRFGDNSQQAQARQQKRQLDQRTVQSNSFIAALVAQRSDVEKEINELRRFKKAVEAVEAGIPNRILERQLPEISVFDSTSAEVEFGAQPRVDVSTEIHLNTTDNRRYQKLIRLAKEHGLTERAVFIITLYESLLKDSAGRLPTKGMVSLLIAAQKASLLTVYGWSSPHHALEEWRQEGDNSTAYLRFRGKIPGVPVLMYSRTSQVLPWTPTEILSQEEIALFQEAVVKKPLSKE